MRIKLLKQNKTLRLLPAFLSVLAAASALAERPLRPVNTYSIVARDATTGELGAAVQSHWFSVGSDVIWAEPGIGAIATQSFIEPSYGPLGLHLIRNGKDASQALQALLSVDQHADVRQIGMIDANSVVANHTGSKAIEEHCHVAGRDFTVQANLMWKPTVCEAMVNAYKGSNGDLGERLMAALEAAEHEGGDIRGKQSAALLVVSGDASLPAWAGRVFDLRVEDHAQPLVELRRLLTMGRAYNFMNAGDEHIVHGDTDAAVAAYRSAEALVPDSHEMLFWHAVTLAGAGELEQALPVFSKAFAMWPKWREAIPRLAAVDLLPNDPVIIEKITSVQ